MLARATGDMFPMLNCCMCSADQAHHKRALREKNISFVSQNLEISEITFQCHQGTSHILATIKRPVAQHMNDLRVINVLFSSLLCSSTQSFLLTPEAFHNACNWMLDAFSMSSTVPGLGGKPGWWHIHEFGS